MITTVFSIGDRNFIKTKSLKYGTLGMAAAGESSLRMLVRSLIFSRFLRQDGLD
jgi:hypothetical protein